MKPLSLLFLSASMLHCSARGDLGFLDSGAEDAQVPDVVAEASDAGCPFCDAALIDVAPPPSPGFFLLASETPYTPSTDSTNWGGIARFNIAGDQQPATAVIGIPKSTTAPMLVGDPLGMAFRWSSAEVFVANRGGNVAGQASISRFPYDAKTQTFGAGSMVVSGFTGFHALAFNPTEDEIFVATLDEGLRRFKLTNSTWTEVLPQLIGSPNWIRGVAVSPDGKRLYATSASYTILQFDLTTNTMLPQYKIADTTAALHFMMLCGPAITGFTKGCSPAQLYVSDALNTGPRAIYRYDLGADDSLTNETKIPSDATFHTALSPDGLELFSGGSSANVIQRFTPSGSTWTPETGTVTTQNNIGTILVFPTNAVPVQIN